MKKIIATVLAMVMALALCTTAFAITYGDLYEFKANAWTTGRHDRQDYHLHQPL